MLHAEDAMRTAQILLATALSVALGSSAARAEVKTKEIEYKQGATPLKGFLAYDDAARGKRPGVLVIHEWWGENEHARHQAERLAHAGYVAFALDMYGNGKTTTHPQDAQAMSAEISKDPQLVAARFDAALEVLKSQPQTDPAKIGVVGYCFGGAIALHMARAGADVSAVAVLHAPLAPNGPPAEKGKVKARILAQEGGADPFVSKDQVEAFKKEMKAAGVKAEVIIYPGARHSFTNPEADKVGMEALHYDEATDKKSWAALVKFLKSTLGA
jgi:dienelactone hydrolase